MNGNRNETDKMRETVAITYIRGKWRRLILYYSWDDDRVMVVGDIKYSQLCEKNTRKYRISSNKKLHPMATTRNIFFCLVSFTFFGWLKHSLLLFSRDLIIHYICCCFVVSWCVIHHEFHSILGSASTIVSVCMFFFWWVSINAMILFQFH